MSEITTYDDAWTTLKSALDELVDEVRAVNPKVWAQVSTYRTGAFLLAAFVAFNRDGVAGAEDLTIATFVQHRDGLFICSVDLLQGDEAFVVDGRELIFPESERPEARLGAAVAQTLEFVADHRLAILDALRTGG